jgi:hypothetical protein
VEPCRVFWDWVFFEWYVTFRPSGVQCYHLFDWVLDVTGQGPPDDAEMAAEPGVWVYTLDDARVDIFYVEWPDRETIGLVSLLSW